MVALVVPLSLAFAAGTALLQLQSELPGASALITISVFGLLVLAGYAWLPVGGGRLLAAIACCACAGFVLAALRAEARMADRLAVALEGQDLVVEGKIDAMPQAIERGTSFSFEIAKAPDGVPSRLMLSWYADSRRGVPELHAGQHWRFTVRLKRPWASINPHGTDFEAWMLGEGLGASGHVRTSLGSSLLDAGPGGLGDRIECLRESVRERFASVLADSPWRGTLVALAIGDQRGVTREQWTLFIRSGVVHLISISGLHIVVWSMLAGGIVGAAWRRVPSCVLRVPVQQMAALAGFLAAAGYCALAGWGVPAQRSLTMLGVAAWSILGSRKVDTGPTLAVALVLVLLRDPWAVFGRGFWLSFGAVALLVYSTHQGRPRSVWRSWLRGQSAIGIGLMPPLIAFTGQVSLVAPLANAVAIPCVSYLVLPAVLLFAVTGWPPAAWFAAFAFEWLARLLEWLATPEWVVWRQAAAPALLIVAGLLGSLILLLPRGVPGRLAGLALILPLLFWRVPRPMHGAFELTLLDVGQGLAAHVRTAGHDLLFDTGPAYGRSSDAGQRIIVPYLRGEGIARLDGLIVSHQDSDHSGGAGSVLADVGADWLMGALPPTSYLRSTATLQRECRRGETWNWDGVRFEILHPMPGAQVTRDGNATSCVMRVSVPGSSVLLTADIPSKVERELAQSGLLHHEEVVVVPHHGSRTSSSAEFIAAVSPETVLIPVGYRSRFGHPHPDVVERYAASGAQIQRNDRDGAIRLQIDGDGRHWIYWRDVMHRYWRTPWAEVPPAMAVDPGGR